MRSPGHWINGQWDGTLGDPTDKTVYVRGVVDVPDEPG
jgi:hypothetical protein